VPGIHVDPRGDRGSWRNLIEERSDSFVALNLADEAAGQRVVRAAPSPPAATGICGRARPTRMSEYRSMAGPSSNRRSSAVPRAVGDPHPASRIINHKLQSAIPLPASAENLQENFSSRLNKDPSTNCLAGSRPARGIA
jgi:hypothetical protein